jgi:hypothetical protein
MRAARVNVRNCSPVRHFLAMAESGEENLEIDWLELMVEKSKSEPVFEGTGWNEILTELGRITVYFDMLEFNLKTLLITLEKPHDLGVDISRYARKQTSNVIEKCKQSLVKLETGAPGRKPALARLFKDCHLELEKCDKLRERRNELIHALWFPQAFPPHSATRLRLEKPKKGGVYEIKSQGHDASELRDAAVEIRNAVPQIHALIIKIRVAFQRVAPGGEGSLDLPR